MALTRLMTLIIAGTSLGLAACQEQPAGKTEAASAKAAAGDSSIQSTLGDATKFAAAVKAAGLDAALAGPGPYTVLVPSDAAFDKLPGGTLDALMKPEARQQLTAVLSYHILPGTILSEDIGRAIDAGKGKASLPTMGGGTITATREGNAIVLSDAAGNRSAVTKTDEKPSNGIIHRVDGVLMPG